MSPISINGDLVQGDQNKFALNLNHGGISMTLIVRVSAPAMLVTPEPGRESTEQRHDICCAAMSRAAQSVFAQLKEAHSIFSQALQAASVADRSAYFASVKSDGSGTESKAGVV